MVLKVFLPDLSRCVICLEAAATPETPRNKTAVPKSVAPAIRTRRIALCLFRLLVHCQNKSRHFSVSDCRSWHQPLLIDCSPIHAVIPVWQPAFSPLDRKIEIKLFERTMIKILHVLWIQFQCSYNKTVHFPFSSTLRKQRKCKKKCFSRHGNITGEKDYEPAYR